MNRLYFKCESKIILIGDTYSIRDAIKKAGGRWDSANKQWWLFDNEKSLSQIKNLGFSLNESGNLKLNEENISSQKNYETQFSDNYNSYKTMNVSHFILFIDSIIKRHISDKYWICGEISGLKTSNNHTFFELVDKENTDSPLNASVRTASISCILWASKRNLLQEKLAKILFQDGIKVKILVSCDFRKEGARISAIIEDIDIQYTQGEIALQRIAIVQELKTQGLYNKNKLTKIQDFPLKIALITAENSRAASDFINELKISQVSFQITIFDCNMQGEKTSENVSYALKKIANSFYLFDCVVITRGGGSRLDLRWFDDLEIAKQIAVCPLPVITAVGHFDDLSIADEVSFLSEKTPTAAARFLANSVANTLSLFFLRLEKISTFLLRRITKEKHQLDTLQERITAAVKRKMEGEKKHIQSLAQILKVFQASIGQTLERGYALAYNENGGLVTGKDFLSNNPPQKLKLEFAKDCTNEHIFVDVSVVKISNKNNHT